MKVLFISGGDCKYGAPKAMLELVFTLQEHYGVEPVVLTKKYNLINMMCDERDIENYSFWYRDIMAGSAYSSSLLNFIKHIIKYICYLYGSFTQHKISNILHNVDDIDLIHTNINRLDIGSYLSARYSIPQVCHLRELRSGHCRIVTYSRNCIRRLSSTNVCFFAISEAVRENWIQAGINRNKIQVIYDGINVEPYKQEYIPDFNELSIVCVGRIEDNKGQIQIVEALSYLPDEIKKTIQVYLVGEAYPEYEMKLKRMVEKYQVNGNVHFTGYCKNIPDILRQCNIGITPSKGEAFGRVTLEYMAAGLAVIASDAGANREILKNGSVGLLYPYGNSKSLARKISYLFYHKNEAKKIARLGRKYAFFYTKERNAQEIYKMYCKLLGQNTGE